MRATVTLPVVSGGLNWTGPWDAAHTYALHDVAAHAGNAWVSLRGGNLNQEPAEGSMWWDLLVRTAPTAPTAPTVSTGCRAREGLRATRTRFARSTRVAAYTSVDTASEWHLTGATGAWTGDRTLRLGGVGATERALLERIARGRARDRLRRRRELGGLHAALRARVLRYRRRRRRAPSRSAPRARGRAADERRRHAPLHPGRRRRAAGNRGLAGYSDRIRRTNKRTSAAAAGQADEWFLTGAGATWVGNRTFTMGGLTEAEEALPRGASRKARW